MKSSFKSLNSYLNDDPNDVEFKISSSIAVVKHSVIFQGKQTKYVLLTALCKTLLITPEDDLCHLQDELIVLLTLFRRDS